VQWSKLPIQSNRATRPFGHGVADVREDASADAGRVEVPSPFDHGRVQIAPEVDVGLDEPGDLRGMSSMPLLAPIRCQ